MLTIFFSPWSLLFIIRCVVSAVNSLPQWGDAEGEQWSLAGIVWLSRL